MLRISSRRIGLTLVETGAYFVKSTELHWIDWTELGKRSKHAVLTFTSTPSEGISNTIWQTVACWLVVDDSTRSTRSTCFYAGVHALAPIAEK